MKYVLGLIYFLLLGVLGFAVIFEMKYIVWIAFFGMMIIIIKVLKEGIGSWYGTK